MEQKYIDRIKHAKFIASFLIVIVLSLPFYTASVHATIIFEVTAENEDGIDGFVKDDDTITFKANAFIDLTDDVTPDQVWLETLGGNEPFETCTGNGPYLCTTTFSSGDFEGFTPFIYKVSLKNDNGDIIDSKTSKIFLDNLKPVITSFQTQDIVFNQGDIEFRYTIQDTACDTSIDSECSGKCSGIEKIEFSSDPSFTGGSFQEITEINSDSCTLSDSLARSINVFQEGENAVYARAFDRLNNPSNVISTIFTVDTTSPTIFANTLKIIDNSNFEINFVAPNNIDAIAKVDIAADDLDKNSVLGDFSELGSQENVRAVCSEAIDDIVTCTWNIKINTNEAGTKSITLEASDFAGNKEVVTILKDFSLDIQGPQVVLLRSSKIQNDNSYVKSIGNTFIAEFIENVGIKKEDALLSIEGRVIQATNCSSSWVCTWDNIGVSGTGTIEVSIHESTTDRLGNSIAEEFSIEVIIDNKAPEVFDIIIAGVGGAEAPIQNIIKTGDSLQIIAFVEDETLESAFADLSEFIIGAENVSADLCLNIAEDEWQCFWTTRPIDIPGFIEDNVVFTFKDIAGNSLQHEEQITVFGLLEETELNFWKHEVSCSPRLIDRQTTSLISQRVFCHVTLEPLQGDVEQVVIDLGQCSGNVEAIQEVELFNAELGSLEPFIKISLKQTEFRVDNIDISCPLKIISRVGNEITTVPETENVKINLRFYNLPLGELSDNLQKDIDDAIEDATGKLQKLIGTLKKIEFYARKICQLNSVLSNIVSLFQSVTYALGEAEKIAGITQVPGALYSLHVARTESCVNIEATKLAQKEAFDLLGGVCKFVTCRQSPFGLGREQIGGPKEPEGPKFNKWTDEGKLGAYWFTAGIGTQILTYFPKSPLEYMNPRDSIVVATLTACIPGIVHGLDKFRQVQCMYAHCLQEGVGKQGLPKTACDDQKSYATCKYVVGEIFNLIPYTALFFFYSNLIRDVLKNPFKILGAGIAASCLPLCGQVIEDPHFACILPKIVAMIGETAQDVQNIIDDGFEMRDDFCSRLETEEG